MTQNRSSVRSLPRPVVRYGYQVKAHAEWLRYRHRYAQNIIFIAGLPKSGSTWLRNMFCSIPGYNAFQPYHVTPTDYSLREDTFRAYSHLLAVLHMHTYWSLENEAILKKEGLRYAIIYRDIRDAAVSWYFFISNVREDHYLRDAVAPLSFEEGINYYIDHYLASEVRWIRDWRTHRDPEMSVEITYEKLRADTLSVFGAASRFICGPLSDAVVETAVLSNSFERVSGRRPGEEDQNAFVRKGISGDWRNKFSEQHKARFKEIAGELLIELGYEQDYNW
jgi:hypothetical protein